jgi:hypothetical protein
MPFHRVLDLEGGYLAAYSPVLGVSGTEQGCIQAEPFFFASVELCVAASGILSKLELESRFAHYVKLQDALDERGGHHFSGWEFGIGPSFGGRSFITGDIGAVVPEVGLSAEVVYWFSKYFGLKLQVDGDLLLAAAAVWEAKLGLAF